ncbi:ROK family protein [bacterium]|nr:ROK family protein [bacterium]
MKRFKIGIDLGGTKLLGVLVDSSYNILKKKKINIQKNNTLDKIIDEIASIYFELSHDLEIEKLGMAVPSSVQFESGIASFLPAYGWKNIPFGQLIKSKIGVEVNVDNDVNMATLAEFKLGAGIGVNSLYTFYPGTGIGGGYISNGKLIRGYNGTAGEIGHMVIDVNGVKCKCGQRGCLETIVSNAGFRRLLNESKNSSSLYNIDNITSDNIVEAWHSADLTVQNILKFQAEVLGIAIANVINITGVERILVGGQIYHLLKDELLPLVIETANDHAISNGMKNVDILLNKLGPEAPALGATLL